MNYKINMNIRFLKTAFFLSFLLFHVPVKAQFDWSRMLGGLSKAVQAVTLTDEQMAEYVKEYMAKMDADNKICPASSSYTVRLRRLTDGLTDAEGIPLNFKVYQVKELNAFACADGSVRVYSSLMDVMTDDELLGVIGHEIGHIAHRDSKRSFRTALLTSALKDGISSSHEKIAALTDSQLGALTEAMVNARYSQKQECAADDYGYTFLKKAGKNPWAMALAFRKLKLLQNNAQESQVGAFLNQLFSSHPDLDMRIERMEERATKEKIAKPMITLRFK